ncbi:MAG: ABC transporter permease [Thermoguttaceae bacterium]
MMVWSLLGVAAVAGFALVVGAKVPLAYNLRNLTVRWRTTLLTALAFTLVIALLVVMLAFVNGLRRLTLASGHPGNVLVLSDGATDEAFSNLNPGELSDVEHLPEVARDQKTGRPLASRETYLIVNQPIPHAAPGRPQRRFLQIRGVEDPAMAARVHEIKLLPGGSWLSSAGARPDPQSAADPGLQPMIEVILGEGIARELGRDRDPEQLAAARNPQRLEVGDIFHLGEDLDTQPVPDAEGRPRRRARKWIVVGVMDSAGSTFDSELWAKQSLVAPLFGKDTFTSLVLRTPDAQTARRLKRFLSDEDPARPGYKIKFNALVERDYYASLTETTDQFLAAIIIVTIFVSIGGVFGVMNTMFAAISQRIKDIGVLRVLGYARWQILLTFLLEALVIALAGGALGCLLGTFAHGWTATSVVTGHSGGGKLVVLRLVVDGQLLALGILVSLGLGLLGGLLPALSAMRLKPLEALR